MIDVYGDPVTTWFIRGIRIADQYVRIFGQIVDAKHSIKVSQKTSQKAIDFVRVRTPKSKTMFLSRSTSMMFSNSA